MDPRTPSLDLEEALRHTDWLRRLALRLVEDPQSADELVQETWIRAWRSSPEEGTSRAWLATVLRRLARGRHRGESRRAARERQRARDEALPATADLVQRAELQKRLTEAVLALPEELREAVLFHYFEGLSSAEIARRQELPASTVRARVRRGLAALREALDRDYGSRAVWSGLVILHFGTAEAAVGAGATVAGAAAAWVGPFGWIAAGVLALAVVFAAWTPERATLPPLDGPTSGEGEDLAVDGAEAAGLRAPPFDAGDREPARAFDAASIAVVRDDLDRDAAAAPAFPPATLAVTLLDTRGEPVRRAWFALEGVEGAAASRVFARADGTALLRVPCDAAEPRLGVALAGGPGVATRAVPVRFAAGDELTLGEWELDPAVRVRGVVTSRDGTPVAGATVKAFGSQVGVVGILDDDRRWVGPSHDTPVPEATTDAAGHFVLEAVPVGSRRLWAGGAGHLWSPGERLRLEAGATVAPQRLVVDPVTPRDHVAGVVRDPGGNPVPFAEVATRMRLANGGTGSLILTDERGAFRVPLRQRVPYEFVAYHPDGRYARVTADAVQPGTDDLELRFRETHEMRVRVRHEDGAVVPRYEWQLTAAKVEAPDVRWFGVDLEDGASADAGARDDDGYAVVRQLDEPFYLGLRVPGRAPMRYGPFEPGEATERIEIVLTALPTITGSVRDADGAVAGARVTLHRLLEADERVVWNGQRLLVAPQPDATATTDDRGGFELAFRGPGHYVLRSETDGAPAAERWPLVLGASSVRGVELRHGAGGALVVRYAREEGRSPAGRVLVLNHGVGDPISARFDEAGELVFEGLTPGKWKLELVDVEPELALEAPRAYRAAGPSPMNWTCEVFEGERTRVVLRDEDPDRRSVAGVVTVDGAPAAGWAARGRLAGVPHDAPWAEAGLDEDGAFRLELGDEGRASICVSAPEDWGNLVVCEEVELDGDGPLAWRLDLWTGSFFATGMPAPTSGSGLQLRQVAPLDGRALLFVSAVAPDENGELFVPRLPVGLWGVVHYDPLAPRADSDNGWRLLGEFVVEAGREARLER